MLGRDLIELVTETQGVKGPLGDPSIDKTYKQVYADKLPISMNETYQAHSQGIRPEFKFKIRYVEYGNEQMIRYPVSSGKEYEVVRTYNNDDEWVELTVKGVVVNGNT